MPAITGALKRWGWTILGLALVLVVIFSISAALDNYWEFADRAPDRGVQLMARDPIDGPQKQLACEGGECFGQNWSPAESLWFGNTTQGSDLMPYDFFMALEQKDSRALFRDDANLNGRYRYLVRHATYNNPDALPVGFVKNRYMGKNYIGFTCAACHTGEVDYRGSVMRIDGAPAMADMNNLIIDLSDALWRTHEDKAKFARFAAAVIARGGDYRNEDAVRHGLEKVATELAAYKIINHVTVPYGYARLDAFGRIYNRLLQHVLSPDALRSALEKMAGAGRITTGQVAQIMGDAEITKAFTTSERDAIVLRMSHYLSAKQMLYVRDELMNRPDAPVSYPFLWDIPQHDFVQWNGIGSNGGLGPLGRNVGEVIGVFATLDWQEKDGWSLATFLTGQGFKTRAVDYQSSADVDNLRKLERQLQSLQSPVWPETVLPKIDRALAAQGEPLFAQHCAECHAIIDRKSKERRIVAFMGNVKDVRTDPRMAGNSVNDMGYSGILRNQYASTGVGKVLLDKRTHVEPLLATAVQNVLVTPARSKSWLTRFYNWIYNLVVSAFDNDIQTTVKNGSYEPDTTANPFASLSAYKGRALDGIWATAPYLHNGSVPALYDLLLPAAPQAGDPPGMEYRPKAFLVGSREFDPAKVGYKSQDYPVDPAAAPGKGHTACVKPGEAERLGYCFDTSKPGNSNAGHEYATRVLTPDQRKALLEFLKTL